MAAIPIQPRVVKFGVFEVDLQAGEVRKAGMRQKLAGQPFQVLQALLEHPQEIVTREDLRERIWPGNAFIDYELALKKAGKITATEDHFYTAMHALMRVRSVRARLAQDRNTT